MSFLIALVGGIITFISPCVLPMIPMYIAYISGISVKELELEKSEKPVLKILINSIFFVIGFAVVFSALAALFYLFVESLGKYKIWFNRGAGILIILFGFHLMGLIRLNFLNYEVKVKTEVKKNSLFSSLLMGAAFGAGWTPCIGPILSGILFTSTSSGSPLQAVALLVTYSLGLGIPFILTGLLTSRLLTLFSAIKKHYKVIEVISGLFLVTLGVLLLFDWMGYLSAFFSKLFPNGLELEGKLIH